MDIKELASNFLPCQECTLANTTETINLPASAQVAATLSNLFSLLFPGCHAKAPVPHAQCREQVERLFAQIAGEIEEQILQVLRYQSREKSDGVSAEENAARARTLAEIFMAELPAIRKRPGFESATLEDLESYIGLDGQTIAETSGGQPLSPNRRSKLLPPLSRRFLSLSPEPGGIMKPLLQGAESA